MTYLIFQWNISFIIAFKVVFIILFFIVCFVYTVFVFIFPFHLKAHSTFRKGLFIHTILMVLIAIMIFSTLVINYCLFSILCMTSKVHILCNLFWIIYLYFVIVALEIEIMLFILKLFLSIFFIGPKFNPCLNKLRIKN